ncbi:carboxypeptidase-like regulatory domain-containing protein, partial [Chryseobacterium sp.]|uniref:carboxypeptidase-like regulatory domain-containing protein n=2 Tax=unclassified Chryseobacterium TaxID=2593645 RepID=UPI0024E1F5FA
MIGCSENVPLLKEIINPGKTKNTNKLLKTKMPQWTKLLFILVFSLINLVKVYAQDTQGGIGGKVNMIDGQPLRAISVSLLGTDHQTLTDDEGAYRFVNLNTGSYTVKFQILGSKEIRLPVEVKAGETTTLDYQ